MKLDMKDVLYIRDMVKNIKDTVEQEKYENYEPFSNVDIILDKCDDILSELALNNK